MFGNQFQGQVPGYVQPFQNPYLDRLGAMSQPQVQRYEIIQVNGRNGAEAFRMAPNSRCLLLDETAPIVWLAQTDGAGYQQLTPYTITPYQPQQAPNPLEERLARLEEKVYGTKSNAPADASASKQPDATDGELRPL